MKSDRSLVQDFSFHTPVARKRELAKYRKDDLGTARGIVLGVVLGVLIYAAVVAALMYA